MQPQIIRLVATELVHGLIPNRTVISRRHLTFSIPRPTNYQQFIPGHLGTPNKQQYKAIFSNPSGALQILAGPGTGKTWVMALRTAKLIKEDQIPPESIFVVTFGRHPAHELRTRLYSLIGQELTDRLKLGTIHRTCLRYVKTYKNPKVIPWDDAMCQQNIRHITRYHVSNEGLIEPITSNIQQAIAKMKVYKGTRKSHLEHIYRSSKFQIDYDTFKRIISDNQETMKHSNALDFDDLVNECRELIEHEPSLVSRTRHILIDEFQDIDMAQYKLICSIARASKSGITVVGDPDQAIFGWRFADTAIFRHMCTDFPHTRVISLNTNYRSTPSILNFANAIIAQDKSRPNRSLCALQAHPAGPLPDLQKRPSIEEEANAIATRIFDLYRKSNGALEYGDFAILLRYNIWKPVFADILKRKDIPFQLLPKSDFYAKNTVLDILAYVFLAFSPQATPWLLRILDNTDMIDGETVKKIQQHALIQKTTAMAIVRSMAHDALYKVDSKAREQLKCLVLLLENIMKKVQSGRKPSQILEYIFQHEFFTNQMKRRARMQWYTFDECRNELQSIVRGAREFESSRLSSGGTLMAAYVDYVEELAKEIQVFDSKNVNVMTVHASRGLEFPIVFIPGVIDGVYPRSTKRKDEYDEDRRLIYVGCTRAKIGLYLTYPAFKETSTKTEPAKLSEFIKKVKPKLYRTFQGPS